MLSRTQFQVQKLYRLSSQGSSGSQKLSRSLQSIVGKLIKQPQEFRRTQVADAQESLIVCQSCYGQFAELDFQKTTSQCSCYYCRQCIREYLKERVLSKRVLKVPCLNAECRAHFAELDLRELLSERLFRKYLRFRREGELVRAGNVFWCPTADCGTPLRRSKKEFLRCPKCAKLVCNRCKQAEHPQLTCEQVSADGFERLAKELNLKPCPKCQSVIEKALGCNHMTCTQCGYQFCWLCLKKYNEHHYKDWNRLFGCPYRMFAEDNEIVLERDSGCVVCCSSCCGTRSSYSWRCLFLSSRLLSRFSCSSLNSRCWM